MPETFKYDRMHLTGNANASPAPITKDPGTECDGRTLGTLGLVDEQSDQVQKAERFLVQESQWQWLDLAYFGIILHH